MNTPAPLSDRNTLSSHSLSSLSGTSLQTSLVPTPAISSITPQRRTYDENEVSPSHVERPKKRTRTSAPNGLDEERRRLWSLYKMDADEAWFKDDDDIIAASRAQWRSIAYDHYTVELIREDINGRRVIKFKFHCKYQDPDHAITVRDRTKTSDGTCNLLLNARACNLRRAPLASTSSPNLNVHPPYSEAHHCTLISLRCASSKRPFHIVEDPWYLEECKLLSQDPNIKVPCAQTVARDVERLYEGLAPRVKEYFKKRGRSIHPVTDGWTSPIHTSNLGIALVWEDDGKMHRSLLEIEKLTERHHGTYLAEVLANFLERYGIADFLHLMNMDNTANGNTMAVALPTRIPHFRGMRDRLRCFLHSVQLIANMIISFFDKQYKRKRAVQAATARSRQSAPHTSSEPQPSAATAATSATAAAAAKEDDDDLDPEVRQVLETEETHEDVLARVALDVGQAEADGRTIRTV